jgi:hypothetical protein
MTEKEEQAAALKEIIMLQLLAEYMKLKDEARRHELPKEAVTPGCSCPFCKKQAGTT